MSSSQARIEANRRNAQRSTGPTTPEGKAASSRNALSHGAHATDDTLLNAPTSPGLPRPANAAAMLAELTAFYAPVGPTESFLVRRLAVLQARLELLAQA